MNECDSFGKDKTVMTKSLFAAEDPPDPSLWQDLQTDWHCSCFVSRIFITCCENTRRIDANLLNEIAVD